MKCFSNSFTFKVLGFLIHLFMCLLYNLLPSVFEFNTDLNVPASGIFTLLEFSVKTSLTIFRGFVIY